MADALSIAKKRSELKHQTFQFFAQKGFLEVETPILVPIPGMEPHLSPFETTFSDGQKLYLNTSPELQMKKLLGAGFPNIYNITKVFRNGEIGGDLHNAEFTMLEWYRRNSDYTDLMKDCEELINHLAPDRYPTPFKRISTQDLFLQYCNINLLANQTFKEFEHAAQKNSLDTAACNDWDDIFFKLFLNNIEPKLRELGAVFVFDYPSSQAALAKKSVKEPFFAERFELYINGIELANAFSELIDTKEQRTRLEEEQLLRQKLGKTVFPIDEEFLTSLESISEPCSGIALGLDRLIMLLLDKKSLEEILLFPLTKMLNEHHN